MSTIAVIGHGRSPEGKGWGQRINACSTVVRMWDWNWQSYRDYGDRYDYGLFVLTPKGLSIFQKNNGMQPRRGWLIYNGNKPISGDLPVGKPLTLLPNVEWQESIKARGGMGESGLFTLTRGGAAAAWAIQEAALALGKTSVLLVGFDNVRLAVNQPIETSFCPEYWQLYMSRFKPDVDKVYPIGTAKTATHDLLAERGFLLRLAEATGVKLQFAQECWL